MKNNFYDVGPWGSKLLEPLGLQLGFKVSKNFSLCIENENKKSATSMAWYLYFCSPSVKF